MKKNPFDDFHQPSISTYGPDGEEIPWHKVAERMRTMPREKESEVLEYLTGQFRKIRKETGETMAIEAFWNEVEELRMLGALSPAMVEALLKVKDPGKINIEAAQMMVRAAPVTIHLPFVANAMRYVIFTHKSGDPGTDVLDDAKKRWKGFLPDRSGGKYTYGAGDIRMLTNLVQKQMGIGLDKARHKVAEALDVSYEYVKKLTKTKNKRGNPHDK